MDHEVEDRAVMIRSLRYKTHSLVRFCHAGVKLKGPGEVDITLSNG